MSQPQAPRLFLVDGYALIYRAFFALGQQPLRSSRGENTSIARGTNDFISRLIEVHKPEYLGWVHDKGLSFRHELFPEYKATRERLEPEQQVDFDEGVARVEELLAGYKIPVLSLDGYEADDVIGTLALQAASAGVIFRQAVDHRFERDESGCREDASSVHFATHHRTLPPCFGDKIERSAE